MSNEVCYKCKGKRWVQGEVCAVDCPVCSIGKIDKLEVDVYVSADRDVNSVLEKFQEKINEIIEYINGNE